MTNTAADGDNEHPLGNDGQFHVTDEPIDLGIYGGEDWISLAIFWALAFVVFYQVFTRYFLGDPAGWTEEIARYLLVAVVFIGASIAVRKNNHIQVDFFYRLMPKPMARLSSIAVDLVRVAFFGYATWLTWLLIQKIGSQRMAIVDLPMGLVFGAMLFGFALMFLRSVQVTWRHWQWGYSVLERPEIALEDKAAIIGAEEAVGESVTPGALMGVFLAMMAGGVPVAIAMAGASLIYVMSTGNIPDFVVIHRMYGGVDSFPLLAVPFFIFAGNLMNSAGITNRIYNFALALVGWLKGGLGHVNVVGSMIFAGMSGTAIADAAGLGTIEIKAMKDHGYSTEFAVGVTAASATVGPIIPPSLPFVIYGMMAGVSIGQLFLAGVVPGILMGLVMMLTVAYYAHVRKYHSDAVFSWRALGKTFAEAFLAMMTPVLLVGGMTLGVFTPTEGAVAASAWALFLGFVWYRTLNWRLLVKISMDTIETTATVLFIVAAASIFGWLLTVTRITEDVATAILSFTQSPAMFLLLANLLMLFVGCFLEPVAAITLLVPVLIPICNKLGIDLVHFGLVMVLNLMIGLLHPPMGTVLFVLSRVARLSFERTTIAILPWLVPLLATLFLCTYVPEIVLWLPRTLFPQ